MKMPVELKPALWGAVAGAVALALVGFTWGGWVTGAKARGMVKTDSEAAVVAALAPICAQQFRAGSEATVKLDELKKLASYEQAPYIEKGGWATMPGATEVLAGVGRGCASILVDAKAA
jgi:hypothetical protein